MKEPALTDEKAAMLALIERGEIKTQLTAHQLRVLEAAARRALETAEQVPNGVRGFLGPETSGLGAHLTVMSGMGAGYFRHVLDVIRALRRARGKKGCR